MNTFRRVPTPAKAVVAVIAATTLIVGLFAAAMSGASASPRASAAVIAADTTATETTAPTDPTPKAATDSILIWPVHTYHISSKVLANDDPNGCATLQVADATQTDDTIVADVEFDPSTHDLTVVSYTRTNKPITKSFTYTVQCAETGVMSDPMTDSVTLRPTFYTKVKLMSHHRARFINRNSTFLSVTDYSHAHKVLMRFRVPANSSVVKKRPHVRNNWQTKLGKYHTPWNFGFLAAW